jgi:hypothetical protein
MLKKIALGGIFSLASVLTFSIATSSSGATTAVHGARVTAPQAPAPQGLCAPGGRC